MVVQHDLRSYPWCYTESHKGLGAEAEGAVAQEPGCTTNVTAQSLS